MRLPHLPTQRQKCPTIQETPFKYTDLQEEKEEEDKEEDLNSIDFRMSDRQKALC